MRSAEEAKERTGCSQLAMVVMVDRHQVAGRPIKSASGGQFIRLKNISEKPNANANQIVTHTDNELPFSTNKTDRRMPIKLRHSKPEAPRFTCSGRKFNSIYFYFILIVIINSIGSIESTSYLNPTWVSRDQQANEIVSATSKLEPAKPHSQSESSTIRKDAKHPVSNTANSHQLLEVAPSSLQPAVVSFDSEITTSGDGQDQQRAQRRSSQSISGEDAAIQRRTDSGSPATRFRVAHINSNNPSEAGSLDHLWLQTALSSNASTNYNADSNNNIDHSPQPQTTNQTNSGVQFDEEHQQHQNQHQRQSNRKDSSSSSDSTVVRANSADQHVARGNQLPGPIYSDEESFSGRMYHEIPVQAELLTPTNNSTGTGHRNDSIDDLIDSTQWTSDELNRTTTSGRPPPQNNSSVWLPNGNTGQQQQNEITGDEKIRRATAPTTTNQHHEGYAPITHNQQPQRATTNDNPSIPVVGQHQQPQTIYYLENGDKWNSAEFHETNNENHPNKIPRQSRPTNEGYRAQSSPQQNRISQQIGFGQSYDELSNKQRQPNYKFNNNFHSGQSSPTMQTPSTFNHQQYSRHKMTTPIPNQYLQSSSFKPMIESHLGLDPQRYNNRYASTHHTQPIRRRQLQQRYPANRQQFSGFQSHHNHHQPNRRFQQQNQLRHQQNFAGDDYSSSSPSKSFFLRNYNPITSLIRPGTSSSNPGNRPRKSLLGTLGNKLNNWSSPSSTSNDINKNAHVALENYFYNSNDHPVGSQFSLPTEPIRSQFPAALPLPFYTTGPGRIQQPTVAPASSTLNQLHPNTGQAHPLANHQLLGPSSYRKPSGHNVMSQQGSQQPASFIPVVAVQVTRTSPAPTRLPLSQDEAQQVQSNSPEMSGAEIEEYLEAKTGQQLNGKHQSNRNNDNNNQANQLPPGLVSYDDFGSLASGSISAPTTRGGNNLVARQPSRDHPTTTTTTVKSALFGYLPHQADAPLLQAMRLMPHLDPSRLGQSVMSTKPSHRQQQQQPTRHNSQQTQETQQFYAQQMDRAQQSVEATMPYINQQQPIAFLGAADETPSLALQLQANNLVQNDVIAHPFALPASGGAAAYDTTNLFANANAMYPTQQQQQQMASNDISSLRPQASPFDVYPSDQYQMHGFQLVSPSSSGGASSMMMSPEATTIDHINPLLFADPATAAFSGAANQPAHQKHQQQQQLATSASDWNAFLPQFAQMMPHSMGNSQFNQHQDFNQAAPAGGSDLFQQQQQHDEQVVQGDQNNNNIESAFETTRNQLSNNKGKKRSSEFFANAGQLLLSALPLLLAPTLGLMFASSPSSTARYHEPNLNGQHSPSSMPLPGSYINSLSSGSVSNSAAPQFFTPTPPAYATSTQQTTHIRNHNNNNNSATQSRSPNLERASAPPIPPNQNNQKSKSTNSIAALTGLRMTPTTTGQTNSSSSHRPAASSTATTIIVTTLSPPPVYSAANSSSAGGLTSLFVNKSSNTYLINDGDDNEESLSPMATNQTIASPSTTILLLDEHSSAGNTDDDDENGAPLSSNDTMMPTNEDQTNGTLVYSTAPFSVGHQELSRNRSATMATQSLFNSDRRSTNSTKIMIESHAQPHPASLLPPLDTSYQGADFDAQFATLKKSNHRASQSHGNQFEYVPAPSSPPPSTTTTTTSTTTTTTNRPTQKNVKNKNQYQYSQVQPMSTANQNNNILSYTTLTNNDHDYDLGELLAPTRRRRRPSSVYKNASRFDERSDSNSNYDETTTTTELYPVSTWPQARRKTVSLVTSSGNRTLFDSSDRYQLNSGQQQQKASASTSARPQRAPEGEVFSNRFVDHDKRQVLPAPVNIVASQQQDQFSGNKKRRRTLSLQDSFVLEKVETSESPPVETTAESRSSEKTPVVAVHRRRRRDVGSTQSISEPNTRAPLTNDTTTSTKANNATQSMSVSRFGKDARVRIKVRRIKKTNTEKSGQIDRSTWKAANSNSSKEASAMDNLNTSESHMNQPQLVNPTPSTHSHNHYGWPSINGDQQPLATVRNSTTSEPMKRDATRSKSAIVTAMITHGDDNDDDDDRLPAAKSNLLDENGNDDEDGHRHYLSSESGDNNVLRDQLLRKKMFLDRIASGQGQKVKELQRHRQTLDSAQSHEGADNSVLSEQFNNRQPEATSSWEIGEEEDGEFSLGGRGRLPGRSYGTPPPHPHLKSASSNNNSMTATKASQRKKTAALELAEDTKKALAKFGTLLLEDTLQIPEPKNASLSRRRKSTRDRQSQQPPNYPPPVRNYDSYESSATERYSARATPAPIDDWPPGTRYSSRGRASGASSAAASDDAAERMPPRVRNRDTHLSSSNASDEDFYPMNQAPHGSRDTHPYQHQQHSAYPNDPEDSRNGHGYSSSSPPFLDSRQQHGGRSNESQQQVSPINRYHHFMATNQLNQTAPERPQHSAAVEPMDMRHSTYSNYTTVAPLNDHHHPHYTYSPQQASYENDYHNDHYRPQPHPHHHYHHSHHPQPPSSYAGQYSNPSRHEMVPPHPNSVEYMQPPPPSSQLPPPTGDYLQQQQNYSSSYPPTSPGAYSAPSSHRATEPVHYQYPHPSQYPNEHPPMPDRPPPPTQKPAYHWPPASADQAPPAHHHHHHHSASGPPHQQPDHYNYGGSQQHSGSYARQQHSNYPAQSPPGASSDWSPPYNQQQYQPTGHGSSPSVPPISSLGAQSNLIGRGGGSMASTTDNNRVVDEYLKRAQFSDSDRDKLMASYLTCDGLLNDNDHCLERLSCEFSDPLNIEKANKLDRAVSSILLGHILINTYIPNQFKSRLKSASVFGYTQSGRCSKYVCNKLINKSSQQSPATSAGDD